MNFNSFVNNLSWKKLTFIIVSAVFAGWIIREVMFWTFFHETKEMLNQFNKQFTEQQKDIQKKITESDDEFIRRNKDFKELSNSFNQTFNEIEQKNADAWDKIEKERVKRETAFDREFEQAPKKMFEQHEKMAKIMRDDFIRDSKQLHKDSQNKVVNSEKLTERSRCELALGRSYDAFPEREDMTLQQRKSRNQAIKLIKQEIAKSEHCESYL